MGLGLVPLVGRLLRQHRRTPSGDRELAPENEPELAPESEPGLAPCSIELAKSPLTPVRGRSLSKAPQSRREAAWVSGCGLLVLTTPN